MITDSAYLTSISSDTFSQQNYKNEISDKNIEKKSYLNLISQNFGDNKNIPSSKFEGVKCFN